MLLENNADVSTTGCELLYKNIGKAAEYLINVSLTTKPYEKISAELVNAGADIKQSNELGETLLIIATRKKMSIEFIKKLIKKGADIKATDKKGHDALYYAKENMMDDVVKLLTAK